MYEPIQNTVQVLFIEIVQDSETDINGDLTAFSKKQFCSLLHASHPPLLLCTCSVQILVDFWMNDKERCLQRMKRIHYIPWLLHFCTSVSCTNHKERKEYIPSNPGGLNKFNSGNLVKTKVGFPITCLSPCQAPMLNNKVFYLLEKTYINWPNWVMGIPVISTT